MKRQQERDVTALIPTLRELTERQQQLFFLLHGAIARHTPEGFARLNDDDVEAAAGALASTFETASRGVIYEHTPDSPVAHRLAADLKAVVEEIRKQGAKVYDHETAVVLRAIERGAHDTRKQLGGDAGAYLAMMGRLLQVNRLAQAASPGGLEESRSSIVLP